MILKQEQLVGTSLLIFLRFWLNSDYNDLLLDVNAGMYRTTKPTEMTFSSNSRWQNRPNRSTNNGDMAERAKRPMSDMNL